MCQIRTDAKKIGLCAMQEDVYNIDWEGKKRLIQCAKEMKIQRYVFCSIKDCDKYQTAAWR